MESNTRKIKNLIFCNNEKDFRELLRAGLDPNFDGGWPIRLAARYGFTTIVETLLEFGANPHLLSASGASTLQLAVYSGEHWNTDKWTSLLSCCDSSQLADGAAVAIIFKNIQALKKILSTGRCNTNIPTTLTGKTLEVLAKGYKLSHLMNPSTIQNYNQHDDTTSPRISRQTNRVVIQVYAPTSTHPDEEVETMYEDVSRVMHGYKTHFTVDKGDFNAKLGKRDGDELQVEQFGFERRIHQEPDRATISPYQGHRNLSPSVARFFHQTANQSCLSPSTGILLMSSPTSDTNG